MAVIKTTNQQLYTGRGPVDYKALVQTYNDLTTEATWTIDGKIVAYNGMITAVWLNKEDTTKNGIYFLFDPAITSGRQTPAVTNEANWHKFAELSDLTALTEQLSAMSNELNGVKTKLATLEASQVVIRRDSEYHFKTTTPKANDICIVDVPGYGIRVKIGDGVSAFADLPYVDEYISKNVDSIIIRGYFYNGQFYADALHVELLEAVVGRIYIDAVSSRLYTYDGVKYEVYKTSLPNATAEIAGVVKLYDTLGQNVDGTMTQKAITNELDDKVEMKVDRAEETLILDTDLF